MLLKDLVDIYLGVTHTPEYVDNGIPFLSVKDISKGKIVFDNCKYISQEEYDSLPTGAKPQVGDMLFCRVGTLGKPIIIEKNTPVFGSFVSLGFLRNKDENVCNLKYLFYWMYSNSFKKQVNANVKGASQVNLNTGWLSKFEIKDHTINEQLQIIERLDNLQSIITLCKKQLEKFDYLVKSRFVEMFGEMELTPQKEEWHPIDSIGTVVGGSTPKTSVAEYWDGEYRWITPAELKADSGRIYDSERKITQAGINSCSLQELPKNTVILTSRAPIGKVAIAGKPFYCNQGFKNVICNEMIVPIYLYYIFLYNVNFLNSLGRGATFKEISKSILEKVKIPVPPIELQKQFAAFVEQTDKSKLAVKQVLEKAETLKKALMQEYFG